MDRSSSGQKLILIFASFIKELRTQLAEVFPVFQEDK